MISWGNALKNARQKDGRILSYTDAREGGANSGRPKKAVIAVMDNGEWKIFSYSVPAAEFVNGSRFNVVRCCRQNACHGINTDHRYKGIRFYFDTDDNWITKLQ